MGGIVKLNQTWGPVRSRLSCVASGAGQSALLRPAAGLPAVSRSDAGLPAVSRSDAGLPAVSRSDAGLPAVSRSDSGPPTARPPASKIPVTGPGQWLLWLALLLPAVTAACAAPNSVALRDPDEVGTGGMETGGEPGAGTGSTEGSGGDGTGGEPDTDPPETWAQFFAQQGLSTIQDMLEAEAGPFTVVGPEEAAVTEGGETYEYSVYYPDADSVEGIDALPGFPVVVWSMTTDLEVQCYPQLQSLASYGFIVVVPSASQVDRRQESILSARELLGTSQWRARMADTDVLGGVAHSLGAIGMYAAVEALGVVAVVGLDATDVLSSGSLAADALFVCKTDGCADAAGQHAGAHYIVSLDTMESIYCTDCGECSVEQLGYPSDVLVIAWMRTHLMTDSLSGFESWLIDGEGL